MKFLFNFYVHFLEKFHKSYQNFKHVHLFIFWINCDWSGIPRLRKPAFWSSMKFYFCAQVPRIISSCRNTLPERCPNMEFFSDLYFPVFSPTLFHQWQSDEFLLWNLEINWAFHNSIKITVKSLIKKG